jgi:transglutaminase-like putative cysteine protease
MNITNTVFELGTGDIAIYRTAIQMAAIIKEYAPLPYIRHTVEDIIGKVEPYNSREEVEAIYSFVQGNVHYVKDPLNYEYIKTPSKLIYEIEQGNATGDCDDVTVLGLTMCRSIGFPTAIKVASYHDDLEFGHVYGLVLIDDYWIPFDTIKADFNLGSEQGDKEHPYPSIRRASVIDVESIFSLAYFL